MPPLLYDPPELHEDAARVDPPMSAGPAPCGRHRMCDGGVRRPPRPVPVWAPLRGVSPVLACVGGRVGLPFIPGAVDVVVVAPLKPRILYKRESEIAG